MIHRITVLISGNGSNLQALIDARDSGRLDLEITHVISNRAGAIGLERAHQAGIPTSTLAHGGFAGRDEFDQALALKIAEQFPDLIVLAGFMRILGHSVLERFDGQMINLHPSLLPHYRGTDTYGRAIEAGDTEHGASMHFVTAELDGGPVISQVRIPIIERDNAGSLAARLAPREHDLVVATVELFSLYSVQYRNGAVIVNGKNLKHPLQLQDDGRFEI